MATGSPSRPRHHQLRIAAARARARWPCRGASPSWTRRRRSRTPAPSRRAPSSSSTRRRASRSPARRWRIGWAISGRSSTFSTPGCWDRRRRSRHSPSASRRQPHNAYAPLRELVRPYILRRLKTDKTRHRRPARQDRGEGLLPPGAQAGGALPAGGRRPAERSSTAPTASSAAASCSRSLMRLKQICNHPSQWLGDGAWSEADSGKFAQPARDRRGDRGASRRRRSSSRSSAR